MNKDKLRIGTEEAARPLNENPGWIYEKIINKVKELMQGENKNR